VWTRYRTGLPVFSRISAIIFRARVGKRPESTTNTPSSPAMATTLPLGMAVFVSGEMKA
jgi:hypothetical protein